ncbi:hypothetical protein L1049_026502 [Liquidambar formosana]|uniref:DNA-directed RNA polymerase subunit n=1 Tax=Liquidambar formosana TaxID=63359 RepID=A0AAP0R6H3_LIQFO
MEGLKVSDANITLSVHPSKHTRVSQAILHEKSSSLFKFNEIFHGVVLAYDVNTQSNIAKILPGLYPYFAVKLKAKLLLFSPKPDMLLEGKVVKLSQESIHVIVLGFSSAIITEEDIREEFRYKTKHGKEVFAMSIELRSQRNGEWVKRLKDLLQSSDVVKHFIVSRCYIPDVCWINAVTQVPHCSKGMD